MSTKRKASVKIAAPFIKPTIKTLTKPSIDESRAAISSTDVHSAKVPESKTIEISSDSDSDYDVSDEDGDVADEGDAEDEDVEMKTTSGGAESGKQISRVEGASGPERPTSPNHTSPQAEGDAEDSDAEPTSPTFGELLRGTIDVPAASSQQPNSSTAIVAHRSQNVIAAPSLSSLGTVLTQALRTEDTDLLESCLQTTSNETIQQTIERLDSSLAGILLTKLAARMHRRPGRAGTLMLWIKWILVAHGGALAAQPDILDRLGALQKVLRERTRALPSLLALKGRLDMLDAQMQLRRRHPRADDSEEGEEEEDVIYVEGEDHDGSDMPVTNGIDARRHGVAEDDDDSGDDELPTTNGLLGDSDDEVDDDSDDSDEVADSDGLDDGLDDDEVDHDDVESAEEDDDSEMDVAPPAKVQKVASSFGKKRR